MKKSTFFGSNLLLVVLGFLYFPALSFAQSDQSNTIRDNEYVVERGFTTENGLPGNGVNMIYQDRSGYIWAATYNGLVRYNGSEFKVYNTSNLKNLRTNRFTSVTLDEDGRIWAGLEYSNFVMIDEEKDSTITYSIENEKFGSSVITNTITFDSDGTVWVGTSGGVVKVQNEELTYLDHLPHQVVNKIIHTDDYIYVLFTESFYRLNKDGSVDKMIAELREDIIYFENSSVVDFQNVDSLVDFLLIDENLYLLSEAGLIKYNNEPELVLTREEVEQGSLHGFMLYENDFYIYGRDGLFRTNLLDSDYVYYSHQSVSDVIVDHEESFWIATISNGIRQFVSTPVYQGADYAILDDRGIAPILESNSGSFFVGVNCGWIYEFDGPEVNHYTAENGIENACIWSLMQEEDGTLWAGSWGGGVYYRPPGQMMFINFEPFVFEDASVFLALFKDSSGNIWFGTYHNGLFRYDGNETEAITTREGEVLSAIRSIYEGEKGDIYIATDEGIGLLSGNEIVILEDLNLLETSNFRTITQDRAGRYYFGSYGGGLLVYEPGEEPVTITMEDGLFDNTISQLAFDDRGNLWLGGNLGVFYIEQSQMDQFLKGEINHLRVSRMGVEEGMTIRETNGGFMPSGQITSDGKFLVPTVQGVNVFDTNRMALNRKSPNVFLEEVEFNGNTFNLNEIKTIPYNTQRIVFKFSGLSFENPENNQYEYMLEGFDKNWIRAGSTQEAIYSSIPPGTYNLQVRASNNDGYWNTEAASFSFRVVPPFWQTTWFYLAIVFLFGILIAGAFRYRVRSIQRYNRQLQQMVDERTEELSESNKELKKHIDEKNKLQSILAHDLRNPFSAILGYIELIRNEFEDKGEREHVEMMKMLLDSGRNTLALLENLLQWSGSKEGGLETRFEMIDVTELVNEAISMTEAQSTFKNIFVRNLIDEPHYVWADRNMILSVIRNLISNAIKFSGRDSIVEISLKEKGEKVIVSVEDSGVGIIEEEQGKIFSSEKMQQKVGTQGEKGIGMGLMLCKEFIDKHDEDIWVSSTPKKGSTFSFSLEKVSEPEEKQIDESKG